MSTSRSREGKDGCTLFEHERKYRCINYYLTNVLDENSDDSDLNTLIDTIRMMSEDDVINIFINSHGGRLDYTIQLINAIKECSGKVVTVIDGICYSAATLVFLAGDEMVLNENISMMCHYYSGGVNGKGGEIEKYVEYIQSFNKAMFSSLYDGFLTKDELRRMFSGEDFWFDFDEISRRLTARNEYLIKKNAASEKKTRTRKADKNAK